MAESNLISQLNQLALYHEEERRNNGVLAQKEEEEENILLTNNNQHVGKGSDANASEDFVQVEYMSPYVIPEEKKEILDEKHSQCHSIEIKDNFNVSTIVKNFVNDLLEQIEEKQCASTTGLVYDKRMTKYYASGYHPERPARVRSMYQKLCDEGLVEQCTLVNPRCATADELTLTHSSEHVTFINSIKDRYDELSELAMNYNSIYFHPAVTEAALLAAGCSVALIEEVIVGSLLNGAAIIRPPGHHALNHCSMGFCHFNNVAVGARVALEKYNLNRILIVDWDVHYGNGTHKMFEDDPRVLFFSLHRYDNGYFWPLDKEANFTSVGVGAGEGYNIHVAWNEGPMGDAEYLHAFEKLLEPIAAEYNPELVLVSCGFDSGAGDPLGDYNVTPAGYAHMTRKLMKFAGGKLVLLLEGGYNLDTISNSMAACVSTLLNHPLPPLNLEEIMESGVESIRNTFLTMQKYWTYLNKIDFGSV